MTIVTIITVAALAVIVLLARGRSGPRVTTIEQTREKDGDDA